MTLADIICFCVLLSPRSSVTSAVYRPERVPEHGCVFLPELLLQLILGLHLMVQLLQKVMDFLLWTHTNTQIAVRSV